MLEHQTNTTSDFFFLMSDHQNTITTNFSFLLLEHQSTITVVDNWKPISALELNLILPKTLVGGGPDEYVGGAYSFLPLCKFFPPPNQNKPFFSSLAKEDAIPPPHITPLFCQFLWTNFLIFLQFAKQTIFALLFGRTIFFFCPKKSHGPPQLSSGRPPNL